ncbi:hypothetical protein MHU86_4871 [Fragilaria crotonensis]|nr:hypothetical protein MHU86_4871 [Fragilaria crotonensis]
MRRELREGGNVAEDRRKILHARLDLLEKKARTAETTSQDHEYHPQVIESVRHAMEQLHQRHPGRMYIVEGRFQADSYIQHLLTTSKVDLAIGNDADFSFIAGAKCLQVSDFRIKLSKNKGIEIDDITIATGFLETIQLTRSHLGSSDVSFKEAEHPLLDGVSDLKTEDPLFDCSSVGK